MKLFEERQTDLEYKDMKTKVEVILRGSDSAVATKLVKKWEEYEIEYERYKQLKAELGALASSYQQAKEEYQDMIRDLDIKYFDLVADSSKTKVIRTMSFLIKISAKPTPHENQETDWESVVNYLVEVMNIPVEVLQEAIKIHTETELVTPKTRLYAPVKLENGENINESVVSDWVKKFFTKVKNAYIKLLHKFSTFDSIMDRLEEQYL